MIIPSTCCETSYCEPFCYMAACSGGALVMKVYEGSGVNEFVRDMQGYFNKVGVLPTSL